MSEVRSIYINMGEWPAGPDYNDYDELQRLYDRFNDEVMRLPPMPGIINNELPQLHTLYKYPVYIAGNVKMTDFDGIPIQGGFRTHIPENPWRMIRLHASQAVSSRRSSKPNEMRYNIAFRQKLDPKFTFCPIMDIDIFGKPISNDTYDAPHYTGQGFLGRLSPGFTRPRYALLTPIYVGLPEMVLWEDDPFYNLDTHGYKSSLKQTYALHNPQRFMDIYDEIVRANSAT